MGRKRQKNRVWLVPVEKDARGEVFADPVNVGVAVLQDIRDELFKVTAALGKLNKKVGKQ